MYDHDSAACHDSSDHPPGDHHDTGGEFGGRVIRWMVVAAATTVGHTVFSGIGGVIGGALAATLLSSEQ